MAFTPTLLPCHFHSLFSIGGTDADCEDSEEEPVKKKSDGPGMKAEGGFLCCYNAVVTGGMSNTWQTALQWSQACIKAIQCTLMCSEDFQTTFRILVDRFTSPEDRNFHSWTISYCTHSLYTLINTCAGSDLITWCIAYLYNNLHVILASSSDCMQPCVKISILFEWLKCYY